MKYGLGWLVTAAILSSSIALAQQTTGMPATPTGPTSMQSGSVSTTGLLPMFGVTVQMDDSWIDSHGFPSQSGTNPSLQKVWDALKVGGFNILRTEVDLSDVKSAVIRTANLCSWAKNNGVMLGLVLRNGKSQAEYSVSVSTFVQTLAGTMAQEPAKSTYGQIVFFELEPDWNNPALMKQGHPNASKDTLLKAASALHKTEVQISQGSGLPPKPVVASASFDWEMVANQSIAGVPYNKDSYQQAYSSLRAWLTPLGTSTDVDVIEVSWFPGSISAGSAENLPTLVGNLSSDFGGKAILLRTGFSTSFHSSDEQQQFYMGSFSGLAKLRAGGSTASNFIGVAFDQALNTARPAPPTSNTQSSIAKWDWSTKSVELASMWKGESPSPDMNWWISSVISGMGIINGQPESVSAAALQNSGGLDALTQINQAVASATVNQAGAMGSKPGTDSQGMNGTTNQTGQMGMSAMGTMPGAGPSSTPPSGSKGFMGALSQTFQAKSQQGLSSILDNVFQRLGTSIQTMGTGSGSRAMASPVSGYPTSPSVPTDNSSMSSMNAGGMTAPTPSSMSFASPAATNNNMGSVPTGGNMSGGMASAPSSMSATPGAAAMPTATPTSVPVAPAVSPTSSTPSPAVNPAQGSGTAVASPKLVGDIAPAGPSGQTPAGVLQKGKLPKVRMPADPADNAPPKADGSGQPQQIAGPTVASAPSTSTTTASIAPSAPLTGATVVPSSTPTDSTKAVVPPAGQAVSAVSRTPEVFAKVGDLTAQGAALAGEPTQLVLPITNPNTTAFSNVRAMLMIDGKPVQTQTVAALMPQETRIVTFPQVVIARPGAHEVKIGIQLQKENSRPQMGVFTQVLTVQPAPSSMSTGSALSKPAGTVSGAVTNAANATAVAKGLATGPTPPSATTKKAELTLVSGDLSCNPAVVVAGQAVDFHVIVRNQSDAPTRAGVLVLTLLADGRPVASTEPALQFAVAGKGTYQANWRAVVPAGNRIEFSASVSADGSIVPGKAQASILIKNQAPAAPRPPTSGPVKRIP